MLPRRLAVLLLCLSACAHAPPASSEPTPADAESGRVVRAFVAAFNAHDVERMLPLASADVEWLSLSGSALTVESRGAPALREAMTGYFQQVPTSHSELEELFVTGRYVTTRERAEWRNAQGPQVQRAVAVYELDGGRILRVWYFPAQR